MADLLTAAQVRMADFYAFCGAHKLRNIFEMRPRRLQARISCFKVKELQDALLKLGLPRTGIKKVR